MGKQAGDGQLNEQQLESPSSPPVSRRPATFVVQLLPHQGNSVFDHHHLAQSYHKPVHQLHLSQLNLLDC
jgi:hypothetical protein